MINQIKKSQSLSIQSLMIMRVLSYVKSLFRIEGQTLKLPNSFGKYTLREVMPKQWSEDTNTLAIYENNSRDMSFVKMLAFDNKNSDYAQLQNEICIYSLLKKYSSAKSNVKTAKYIAHFEKPHMLMLCIEYIDGIRADTLSATQKLTMLRASRDFLSEIGSKLTAQEKANIPQRAGVHYVFLYPILCVVAVVRNPHSVKEIFSGLGIFLKNAHFLLNTLPLSLVHRDLHSKNIILSNNDYYLIDFESCAFTIPLYDAVISLWHEWEDKDFSRKFIEDIEKQNRNNPHFKDYFKLLITLVCTHALTASNYSKKDIQIINDFLAFGISYN